MAGTYKILLFMKRRPGMTVKEFRDYYENVHGPLSTEHARNVTHYIRRYIEPLPHLETGAWDDPPFDVITEIWYDDEATFRSLVDITTTSIMPREIIEDEEHLFDRSSFRIATVIERETDLGHPDEPS
jgi:EthD domain